MITFMLDQPRNHKVLERLTTSRLNTLHKDSRTQRFINFFDSRDFKNKKAKK